jgi:plasmid maintenance system antidote protein VapI
MAVRLERAWGGPADVWMRMQINYDLAQVRARTMRVRRLTPKAA